MTASHQGERLSAASVGFLTTGSLFFLAGAWQGLALYGMWTLVGGLYLQELLGTLPMGRRQETEADYLGLIMTAEACYDPRQAIGFWQRMEEMTRGAGDIPEMLSTHPSVSSSSLSSTCADDAERKQDQEDSRVAAEGDGEARGERLQRNSSICQQI
jgi:predicted Zn-dependent protease